MLQLTSHRSRPDRLTRVFGVFTLVVAAANAHAARFSLMVVDNGGIPNGALGTPITPSSGEFYFAPQVATPQALPPSRADVIANPALQYTTYLAMGGGPVSPGDAANPPANLINPADGGPSAKPGVITGVRYNFPMVVIDPAANPFGASPTHSVAGPLGESTLFLGRFVVRRGERPVCPAFVLGLRFDHLNLSREGMIWPAVIRAQLDGPSELIGPDREFASNPVPTDSVLIRSLLSEQVSIEGWGEADIYDVYAVSHADPPTNLKARREATKYIPKEARKPKLRPVGKKHPVASNNPDLLHKHEGATPGAEPVGPAPGQPVNLRNSVVTTFIKWVSGS